MGELNKQANYVRALSSSNKEKIYRITDISRTKVCPRTEFMSKELSDNQSVPIGFILKSTVDPTLPPPPLPPAAATQLIQYC